MTADARLKQARDWWEQTSETWAVLEAALTNQQKALLLLVVSFGSLQRIDFLPILLFYLVMSCKITGAGFPLNGRIRITAAELPAGKFHSALTSLALIHDLMAGTAVVATSRFRHEGAFGSHLHCWANHDNHPLFWYNFVFQVGKTVRIITWN